MPNVTLKQANTIIDAAIRAARERGLAQICVSVLDGSGYLVAMQREDGATFMRPAVSMAKAWGAAGLGVNSRDISVRYEKAPRESGFINALNAMSDGRVIPLPGGVLIINDDGKVCGAVGVSGALSEDDEACALAGIKAAGLKSTIVD
ncbi:MAG: heme-binding protein [Gammaproteobacteria bacterium]|nr:heme-binding protein [Gammaproteobacteria bacterium]